jgi:hypothetical protein
MTSKEWIDLLQAISILVGIWVAIAGLGVWRQEYISKRRIELAEEWLAALYAFRDAIRYIRNPFSYGGEGATRPREEGEATEDAKVRDARNRGYVYFERVEKQQQALSNFAKMKYGVMARFGKHTEAIYLKANRIMAELNNAANTLARHWYEGATRPAALPQERGNHIERAEARIWSGDENDDIDRRLEEVVAEVEKEVKQVTEEKHGLAELLNLPLPLKRFFKWIFTAKKVFVVIALVALVLGWLWWSNRVSKDEAATIADKVIAEYCVKERLDKAAFGRPEISSEPSYPYIFDYTNKGKPEHLVRVYVSGSGRVELHRMMDEGKSN